MVTQPFAIAAIIAAITALSFWLDRRFAWARTVGASLLVIVFGALLSNFDVVPAASPVYDAIVGPVTSLSIVWLLFAVDLRDLRLAGGPMLLAFAIACIATAAGAVAAGLLFADVLEGDVPWKLAGVMTGTYSGGSVNFVGVARALDFPPSLFAAATASDAVMTAVWMGATLVLPLWLGRFYSKKVPEHQGQEVPEHPFFAETPLRIFDLTVLLGLGLALLWAAAAAEAAFPGIPSILWLTTFALVVGHARPVQQLSGAMHLGTLGLHLFFVVIGIFSRIAEIVAVGPAIFWFTALVVAVHGVLTYVGCRVARLDVGTTSVASQAAVGGPASAIAVAVARGWHALALPGIVAGLLGYGVGNYLGVGVAWLVRSILGG